MKAYLHNKEHNIPIPPPEARWSRPAVLDGEKGRVYYAMSSKGAFYFRDLSEAQKADWDILNQRHHSHKEESIANELRTDTKER